MGAGSRKCKVIAGAILLTASSDDCYGVTDMVEYTASRHNDTLVSQLHFLPPGFDQDFTKQVHGAFNRLILSARRKRFGQIDKEERRAPVSSCYGQLFHAMAQKEFQLGVLITVEGERLKIWFESVTDLQRALGDIQFQSMYAAGTPFILQPPFGIIWSPSKGKCWVRCTPEKCILPSGQILVGDEDQGSEAEGSGGEGSGGEGGDDEPEEIPAEEFEMLNRVRV